MAITYDGSSRASGIRLHADGRRLPVEVLRDHLYKDIHHRAEWGDAEVGRVHLTLAGRFRDSGLKNGMIDEFKVYDAELTFAEIDQLYRQDDPARAPLPPIPFSRGADLEAAFDHYLARHDQPYQSALAALHAARVAENELIHPVREIMVMQELPEPRPAFVLRRGAYDAPGDQVEPGVPERIMPLPAGLPSNRLGLARWITDPAHPLTARVAVNRVWKHHFGRGLVETTWDFGAQGQVPSHPELLDWLARRFINSGWDRKALHKFIVMSATYRQSSQVSPQGLGRDPENRLLARGPRHRLEAEQIRDGALAASGLLVPVIGGPSVKPYQPPGVWEDAGTGKKYVQDTGANLYRRSLYTFWRRTAPPPNMVTFDATTREVCTAKREITTTPLQALVLLNDPQFLEASRALAKDLLARHPHSPAARAREAFRRLTGRPPDLRELEILRQLYAEQRALFAAHPEAAAKFLALKEADGIHTQKLMDWAATAVMAGTLINHDEFITKR
jgi:hypothetical protein